MTETVKEKHWSNDLAALLTEEQRIAIRLMEASPVQQDSDREDYAICPFCYSADPILDSNISDRESLCLVCGNIYRVIVTEIGGDTND